MAPESSDGDTGRCVFLIGDGSLTDSGQRALDSAGASVGRLRDPDDDDIRDALHDDVDSVGIVRDVNRIGGAFLAAAALGTQAREAFLESRRCT